MARVKFFFVGSRCSAFFSELNDVLWRYREIVEIFIG